jgi:hypothetical protein
MNMTKELSESLLAACKAAGIENPRYIAQDKDEPYVWHYDLKPDTIESGMWTVDNGIGTKIHHPPYADDWQDSLMEWVEHIADTSKMIDRYTVEPHGKGYAVYLGRDNKDNGANLAHLSECSPAFADQIQALLNGRYTPQANQASLDDACKLGYQKMIDEYAGRRTEAQVYERAWQEALAWKGGEKPVTDEQINIAIAESLGWKLLANNRWTRPCGFYADLPNYTADLNACHELEKTLNTDDARSYYRILELQLGWESASATARQRCEAYLKTIGKWIE